MTKLLDAIMVVACVVGLVCAYIVVGFEPLYGLSMASINLGATGFYFWMRRTFG